jgi:Fe-S cluster biogenesis protein NfuA
LKRFEAHFMRGIRGKANPAPDFKKGKPMREKVQAAIDKIRPMLKADGGDVELVDVKPDGTVQVRLQGACSGCPMSQMTLKNGIERIIKESVPAVKTVEAV